MIQSFFNGLSGMFTFSKGLDNVSNNISNMNTPGYKGKNIFLRSVQGQDGSGYGTELAHVEIRQQEGEIRQTGNDTDLAISGEGYFVLRNSEGEQFYTRAGQFKFNEDGVLVDSVSDYSVLAISESGQLEEINISSNRILAPEATTEVNLVGNLDSSSQSASIDDIEVYDASGQTHTLTVNLTNASATTPNSWTVEVLNSSSESLATFEIRFDADGSPLEGFNHSVETLTLGDDPQDIDFVFGEPGLFNGTTQFSGGESDVVGNVEDGHQAVGLRSVEFDESGVMKFTYVNGDEEDGVQLALASFYDSSVLATSTGSLFTVAETNAVELGRANEQQFGQVQSRSIELSNVDLTQEFADILIIQRGYQASSQVMNVANEMLEQLYNSTRR